MKHKLRHILAIAATLIATSCAEDAIVENAFSSHIARFYVGTSISTILPLYKAANNPGMFCKVRRSGNAKLYFLAPDQDPQPYDLSYISTSYARYQLGVSNMGLFIGMPSIPPVGETQSVLVCYDFCCPNCYDTGYNKELEFETQGQAHCPICQRTYSLDNNGYVISGPDGHRLFRYRIYNYGTNGLVVENG